jgi:hypothetical protein
VGARSAATARRRISAPDVTNPASSSSIGTAPIAVLGDEVGGTVDLGAG